MCTKIRYRLEDRNTGKISFTGDSAEVEKLFLHYKVQRIPCGVCKECRIQHAQEWAFRCMMEAKKYEKNTMFTLTYDDEHVPKNIKVDKETGEVKEVLTLKKKDLQDFKKRLRKHYPNIKIRTYDAGEYGGEEKYIDHYGQERKGTKRPHYHMIVYNLEPEDMKFYKWSVTEWSKEKNPLFKSKTIDKIWGKGWVDLNEVTYESCAYCARYVMKKWKGQKAKEHYEEEGIEPEFQTCSQGIGKDFYTENRSGIVTGKAYWQVTKKGLKKIQMPRYFDKLLEKEDPELLERIKKKRQKVKDQFWNEVLNKTDISKTEYIKNQDLRSEKYNKLIRPLK